MDISNMQKSQLESFSLNLTNLSNSIEKKLEHFRQATDTKLQNFQAEQGNSAKQAREELANSLKAVTEILIKQLSESSSLMKNEITLFSEQLGRLTQSNETKLDQLKEKVEEKLANIQANNDKKLEEMRSTVDEKLHATLEKRLGESFKLVSERLELVHKGLGEMQSLAVGVGDLKKALTNIKTRGTWGEVQLGSLIEQILTPEQYSVNIATKKGSNCVVEYAVKMPGRSKEFDEVLYLPIDAKFPLEDYQRLCEAQDNANVIMTEEAHKALEYRIKQEAKDICTKYIDPPGTTDFAILFLPTEGLYAEVLRRPGLCDIIQRESRVIVAGPTTLAAILNGLQMGFRTLAIEKRSSEVWKLLSAIKTDFGSFGDILDKTKKKLQEAGNTIDTASKASRRIERRLKDVQALPAEASESFLTENNQTNINTDPSDLQSS
ncbi:MAG: DNA recombination protein RmuC [Ignavibacteria bacterium]